MKILNNIWRIFPRLKSILKYLAGRASIVEIAPVSFSGWKMATGTRPPWDNGGNNSVSSGFTQCDTELASLIESKSVILTQFRRETVSNEVKALRWRHYIVYWSAQFAINNTQCDLKNFVEMGVCDGLTTWYATRGMLDATNSDQQNEGSFFLYDAWQAMRGDLLTSSEQKSEGSYAYLNIENTRRNLLTSGYKKYVFNKGFVPESFPVSENPDSLVWLHIDLNSALPTIASLDLFWARLVPGGVILLDDFAWPGYKDTQSGVETWCKGIGCQIMQLPTGQAIIFKQTR